MKKVYMPVKKKTILIIDDDAIAVRIYRDVFQRHGYRLETAGNGEQAMRHLRSVPIDVVVLDLCLSGLDGVNILSQIRSEFEPLLPVIVLSNAYLGELMRTAVTAGATKCVTKTENTPSRLLELFRELLTKDPSPEAGAASMAVKDSADAGPVTQAEVDFRLELAGTLLGSAPQTLAALRAGHLVLTREGPDDARCLKLVEMHDRIHSVTGSAGLLGFRKIAQLANALEGLLIELHAKPKKITPSVARTFGQAIDILACLTEAAMCSSPEESQLPKILVVDDDIISSETICSALGKAGLPAVSLDDSFGAQRLLEQDRFDLIFLDVEMPGQNGIELCANIRAMPTNRVTPVVFVTAHSDFAVRAQTALSGGNDFILKPFLLVELALKALTWLFRESPHQPATPSSPSSSPDVVADSKSEQ